MKRFNLLIAMLVLATSFLTAQEKKENVAVLSEFTDIEASGNVTIYLIQTESFHGISNNPNVEFYSAGSLSISSKRVSRGDEPEIVEVYFTKLENLVLEGNVIVATAENQQIQGSALNIVLSGASSALLTAKCDEMNVVLDDKTQLILRGNVGELNVVAGGAAEIMTENVEIGTLNLVLDDAARVLTSAEKARGSVSGASLLNFLNEDVNSTVTQSGAATVVAAKDEKKSETTRINIDRNQNENDTTNDTYTYQSDNIYFNIDTNTRSITIKYDDVVKKTEKNCKRRHRVYGSFGLGFNSYGQDFFRHTLPKGYENMELSPNISQTYRFDINHDVHIGNSGFYASYGLGIGWNIYKFLDERLIPGKDKDAGVFVLNPYAGPEDRVYKKSKLQSSWLRVPIGLKYQSRQKFYVYAGIAGGVKIGSSAKQVYNHPETGKERVKTKNDFYLNSLRADLEVRVGYRGVGIFATYGLTDLFLKNHGLQLTPFSFGIIL